MRTIELLLIIALSVVGCNNVESDQVEADSITSGEKYTPKAYRNPVIADSVPDPSVLEAKDGSFYLVGTEDLRNMYVYKSSNLISWSRKSTAFTDKSHPNWISGGMMWAPELNYVDGLYIIYYSLANVDTGKFGIGAAYSTTPLGPYFDNGKIIQQNLDVHTGGCTIDQFFFSEDGHNCMFYGSYGGIYWFELSTDGLKKISEGEPKLFAGGDYEATMIHKRGEYYYFFGSLNGYTSNYQLSVSRSKNLFGPYVNKKGVSSLTGGGYEVVMKGNSMFNNTGHCSKIITDDNGTDWILLHAYTTSSQQTGRHPHLYKITWTEDGWPIIGNNGYPADYFNYAPYFD